MAAATAQDVIDVLRSIDKSLGLLVAHLGAAEKTSQPMQTASVPRIASDADLDSKYGNPVVRSKSPRDWTLEDQIGKPFSECPPEYLEMVADRLDYFSETEEDAKKLKYQRLDASRARGWAKRIRGGWTRPVEQAAAFPSDAAVDDEDPIPF